MITKELLKTINPEVSHSKLDLDQIVAGLNKLFQDEKYAINTVNRKAGFIAQTMHESGGYRLMVENLNYSAKGLLATFKKYFTPEEAAKYERKPEMIANRAYANRMDNGPEASGDGWKYRGRGFIQLTGKHNYSKFSTSIGKPLEESVKYLETIEGAIFSAAWYWQERKINKYCDENDIVGMTKAINGGTVGLDERTRLYAKAQQLVK